MNISQFIYEYLFTYYIILYLCSVPFLSIIFWFWLTYAERNHIRMKAKNMGLLLQNKLKRYLIKDTMTLIEKYFYNQLNTFGEIIAGFSDGLLNKESTINIHYVKDIDSQSIMSYFNQNENETQTILSYNNKEGDKDVDKEGDKEGDKEVDKEENKEENKKENKEENKKENKEENKKENKEETKEETKEENKHNNANTSFKKELTDQIPIKKIFKFGAKNKLDTEILEKDIDEDNKCIIKPKNKRITIIKR